MFVKFVYVQRKIRVVSKLCNKMMLFSGWNMIFFFLLNKVEYDCCLFLRHIASCWSAGLLCMLECWFILLCMYVPLSLFQFIGPILIYGLQNRLSHDL